MENAKSSFGIPQGLRTTTFIEDTGGDENGRGDDTNERPVDGRNERAARAANWAKKRNGGRQGSNAKQFLDFHDMLLGIWMLNARDGQHKDYAMKAEI